MIVWELADWQTFVNFRNFFQFENEPASTDLVKRLSGLRRGGRRRLMLQAAVLPAVVLPAAGLHVVVVEPVLVGLGRPV